MSASALRDHGHPAEAGVRGAVAGAVRWRVERVRDAEEHLKTLLKLTEMQKYPSTPGAPLGSLRLLRSPRRPYYHWPPRIAQRVTPIYASPRADDAARAIGCDGDG